MPTADTPPRLVPAPTTRQDPIRMPAIGETIHLHVPGYNPAAFTVVQHLERGFRAQITEKAPKGKAWNLRAVPNGGRVYWGDIPLVAWSRTSRHLKLRMAIQPIVQRTAPAGSVVGLTPPKAQP